MSLILQRQNTGWTPGISFFLHNYLRENKGWGWILISPRGIITCEWCSPNINQFTASSDLHLAPSSKETFPVTSHWPCFIVICLVFSCVASQNSPPRNQLCEHRKQNRTDLAKLTFDLYKNNPKDFIGCLNVKATLYGVYSVSYDLRCYAAKKMLKWVKEAAKYPRPCDIFMLLFELLYNSCVCFSSC